MNSRFYISIFLIIFFTMKLGGCFDRLFQKNIKLDRQVLEKVQYDREHMDFQTIRDINDAYIQQRQQERQQQ